MMNCIRAAAVIGVIAIGGQTFASGASVVPPQSKSLISKEKATRLLAQAAGQFTENVGQWDKAGLFVSRSKDVDLWVTRRGAKFDFHEIHRGGKSGQVVDMSFVGGATTLAADGQDQKEGRFSYMHGRSMHSFDANRYGSILQHSVYPGVDVRYYRVSNGPRYDLIVAPGANPSQIAIRLSGSNKITVSKSKVTMVTELGSITHSNLVAYQGSGTAKHSVPVSFVQKPNGTIGFQVGSYDHSQALVIDPLVYGSYYGGDGGWDEVRSVVSDANGGVYLVGSTQAFKFPAIQGPYAFNLNGAQDAFVSKLQGDAYANIYASFLGGSGSEYAGFARLDPFGNLWVAGRTDSNDFPGSTRQNVQFLRLRQNVLEPTDYPTGGTFQIVLSDPASGQTVTTPSLPYNASDSAIQTALNSLPAFSSSQPFTVTAVNGQQLPQGTLKITSDPNLYAGPMSTFCTYRGPDSQMPQFDGSVTNVGLEARFRLRKGGNGNVIQNLGTSCDYSPGITNAYLASQRPGTFKITHFNPAAATANPNPATTTAITWDGSNLPTVFPVSAKILLDALTALGTTNGGKWQVTLGAGPGYTGTTILYQDPPPAGGGSAGPFHALPDSQLWISYQSTTTMFPRPVYEVYRPHDVFVMRWGRTPNGLLNPIPTQSLILGGDQTQGNGFYDMTLAGFDVLQQSNPSASAPVQFAFAGNTDGVLDNIPSSATNPFAPGYLARYSYTKAGFQKVAVNYVGEGAPLLIAGVALDRANNAYIAGQVLFNGNDDFPSRDGIFTTVGAKWGVVDASGRSDAEKIRLSDCFIRKYNSNNSKIVYSGLIGGNDYDYIGGFDQNPDGTIENTGSAIAVDQQNNAYIVGVTGSSNFPRTLGTFGQTFAGPPAATMFLTKVSADASHYVYSTSLNTQMTLRGLPIDANIPGLGRQTYFPFPFIPGGISVDSSGRAFITGNGHPQSVTFPDSAPPNNPGDPNEPTAAEYPSLGTFPTTTDGADYSVTWDHYATPDTMNSIGFLTVIDPPAQHVVYSSYFGGKLENQVFAPYVDSFGDVWVVGSVTTVRGYSRVGTTTVKTYGAEGGDLQGIFISPLAFKRVRDSVANTTQQTLYGGWGTIHLGNQSLPLTIPITDAKDGFIVKLRIGTPAVSSITFNPATVPGGQGATSTGTVTLTSAAPAGGADVQVSLPDTASASLAQNADVASTVFNIPAGATTLNFTVYTKPVTTSTPVVVRATYLGSFQQAQLNVVPWLQGIAVNPNSVVGGNSTTGRVTLSAIAPAAGVVVNLSTNFTTLVSFPSASIVVPSGQQSATFTVNTSGVSTKTFASVTASVSGVNFTSSLTLLTSNVATLTFAPPIIAGLGTTTGTLSLDGQAGKPGFDVALGGLPAGYSIQDSTGKTITKVSFAAGDTSKTFNVVTPYEANQVVRTVTATRSAVSGTGYLAGSVSGAFTVTVTNTKGLILTPNPVNGGNTVSGEIDIASPAPAGGVAIAVSVDSRYLSFGTQTPVTTTGGTSVLSVLIPEGASSATFSLNTAVSGDDIKTTVTAGRGTDVQSQVLEILPATFSLVIDPNSVVGGQSSNGKVTLSSPAGANGLVISLASSAPKVLQVPKSIKVQPGETSASFSVTTSAVSSGVDVLVTATLGKTQTANQSVTVRAPGVTTVSFSPPSVKGGFAATTKKLQVTINLDSPAPASGVVIYLAVSNSQLIGVPTSIKIPAGASSGSFYVGANAVSRNQVTTISASTAGNGESASGSVTITKGP